MSASNFELSRFASEVGIGMIDALGRAASFAVPREKGSAPNPYDLNTLRENIRGQISGLSVYMFGPKFKSCESQNEKAIVNLITSAIKYICELKTIAQQIIDADNEGHFELNLNEKTFYKTILASVQGWIEQLENHFPSIKEQNKDIAASSSSSASAVPFNISSSAMTVFGAHPQQRNRDVAEERKFEFTNSQS